MKVRDVMTTPAHFVAPDLPLKEAAAILARERISGLPVVAADGEVVGVLSEGDVVAKIAKTERKGGLLAWFLDPRDLWLEERAGAVTVEDAMTVPPVTITPVRPVTEAANLMIASDVNRIPVVDEGKLVGIVTRADLVRAFTRTDEDIRHEIQDDLLRKTMWLEPTDVSVAVEAGRVTLSGRVETESDAELLPRLVRRVPGVVEVESTVVARGLAKV
ncbi:MAG: CBS domain-containing protein [Gaiella sp.]